MRDWRETRRRARFATSPAAGWRRRPWITPCGCPRSRRRCRRALARLGAGALQDRFGGLLGHDVDGADDEEAGDAREHRRVDDPQTPRAADANAVLDSAFRVRGMVSPGGVAHVVGDLGVAG